MFSAPFLKRQSAWVIPAIFLVGLCLSALVGWISATWTGRQAGFGVFGLLGAVTLVMTALLAWALRLAARETHRAESALAERPRDERLNAYMAQAYGLLGQRAAQHAAQAESYAVQGMLSEAIEQLELAQRAGDGDFYRLSAVDARLRQLRARRADEKRDEGRRSRGG